MNESVCRLCRRYAGKSRVSRGWLCAKFLEARPSQVIPGFMFFEKDEMHPMTEGRREIPEWCERPLEQVVVPAGMELQARKDPQLEYDGNKEAEIYVMRKNDRRGW